MGRQVASRPAKCATATFADETFDIPTITELEKPGRDPRPELKMATFKEGVEKITELKRLERLPPIQIRTTRRRASMASG